MNVTLENGVADLFRKLLKEEADDAVIRLRETKIGNACDSTIILRAGVDEREDDDIETRVDSFTIVMSEDFADQYGQDFTIFLCERGMPTAKPVG